MSLQPSFGWQTHGHPGTKKNIQWAKTPVVSNGACCLWLGPHSSTHSVHPYSPTPHVFWDEVGHVSILGFLRRLGLWMNVHCKLKIHEMWILPCCYLFRKLNLSRHMVQCLWLWSAVHGQCGECQSSSFCETQVSDLCPSSDVVILEIILTKEIFSLLSLLSGQSYRPVPPGLPRSPMLFEKKNHFQIYTWHNQSLACKMCGVQLEHRSPGTSNHCRCTALLNEGWKEGRESKWF